MKSAKLIIIATLVAFVSIVQAQKTFVPSDVIGGKTIVKWAKEWDLKAFQQTKEVYQKGMSQEAFIKAIKSNFPAQASASFKEVFVPYYEYVYTLHTRGLTDAQVVNAVTGRETTEMINGLSTWNANNPGVLIEAAKWPWKKILEILDIIIIS
ncbi:MAG: hypothetical protein IPH20_04255 [Bacteroidales bacterium]|nr:hypothetical protein [Bacteroidales bacterium]